MPNISNTDCNLIREQLQARRDGFNDTMACVPEIGDQIKKLDYLLNKLPVTITVTVPARR